LSILLINLCEKASKANNNNNSSCFVTCSAVYAKCKIRHFLFLFLFCWCWSPLLFAHCLGCQCTLEECLPGVKNLFLEKIKDFFLLQWESAAVEWRVLLRESEKSNVWWCQQKLLSKWPFTINLLKTFIPFRKLFQVQKAFQYIDETVTMSISNLISVDCLV